MSTTIRVGTASPSTQPNTPSTIALLSQIASRAGRQNIDILLLPEAFIGGYPRGTTFGCKIGERTEEGREEFARYFEQAVDLGDTVGNGAGAGSKWVRREMGGGHGDGEGGEDGKVRGDGTREELERIARDTGVFIVTGLIEKAGGSLYCAIVYVCPKQGIIGKRRKVQPTGMERLIWAQGSPSTLRAISTTIRGHRVNLAAAICWENYMPLLRQSLYAQNVNLYLAPTADARDSWMSLMRTVGIEGRCFVVSSNMCVRDPTYFSSSAIAGSGRGAFQQQSSSYRERDESPRQIRRSSIITEEGFEIPMPPSPQQQQPPSPSRRHKRRKSVFDEDGNEIVLRCDEDAEIQQEDEPNVNGTHTAIRVKKSTTTAALPSSAFLCRGGSSIVSPFGDVLAGPQWEDDDNLIYADIDLRDCIKGRLDLDTAGSYSRNDSFKFTVEGLDLDPLPY